jgi:phosphate transport system ATP-binding protein
MGYGPHISVRNLNVFYGGSQALKNICIDIPDGQITAIIGPSGCGKTTLLRCFNRLIDTTDNVRVEGEVLVDGENILDPGADVTRIRKKMGLLSQKPFPLPMSIYDNIAYGPRIHGNKSRKALDAIVEKYLKMVNIWDEVKDRLGEPASSLSIGQQQRVCLARGLAVEPAIILADEPTSALDPLSSRHIEEQFRGLKSQYTIVLVTHILRQARRLADYIAFVYLGELVEHGPSMEIFENPKEQITKEYIKGIIS